MYFSEATTVDTAIPLFPWVPQQALLYRVCPLLCSYTDEKFYEECKQEYLEEKLKYEETGERQNTKRTSSWYTTSYFL